MDAQHAAELELLLWAVWDPIEGVPLNEYGRYVGPIWGLLADDASVDVVAAELARMAREEMGLPANDETAAAQRLKEWWYWRFIFPEEFAAGSGTREPSGDREELRDDSVDR